MTQQDLLYLMRKPQLDDLATNEYGDRAYGKLPDAPFNPFEDAYDRALARLQNPRILAPGITYDGRSGNLDTPEDINREVFKPLQETYRPTGREAWGVSPGSAIIDQNGNIIGSVPSAASTREMYDTITTDYPEVPEKQAIPAHEEGKWNPFVPNRMVPEVPAVPAQLKHSVTRRIPRSNALNGTNQADFAPAPVALPTAPTSPVIRYRLVNGQLVQ